MARSVAIILMLEGHMTGACLADEYRNLQSPVFNIWQYIHGITSPLFFTVSGIIFAYLLSADIRLPYLKNKRVRKGYKRVLELLFWGYFLQVNLRTVFHALTTGESYDTDWLNAFHVLQSIGLGIFLLLLIYGVFKLIRVIPLSVLYFAAAVVIFGFNGYLENYIFAQKNHAAAGNIVQPYYIPVHAPAFIQNIIYGQYSEFSFIRYGGYTLIGGGIGAIIRHFNHRIISVRSGLLFIATGLLFFYFSYPLLELLDEFLFNRRWELKRVQIFNEPAMAGLGVILVLLGWLIIINTYVNMRSNLFLKMGQNTLPIYVVHVMILYGGIFGFGLHPEIIHHNLGPYASILCSVLFIAAFFVFVRYIESLNKIRNRIFSSPKKTSGSS